MEWYILRLAKNIQQEALFVNQLQLPMIAVDPYLNGEPLFPMQNGGFEKQGRRVGNENKIWLPTQ